MSGAVTENRNWREILLLWFAPQSIGMFFLGFSAGLPLLLIFATLSIWLTEAGVVRSTVTFFSWAALAYSFKFLWAPIVDMLPLPVLSKLLGRRRGWLFFAQLMIIAAIITMALVDPAEGPTSLVLMAIGAVMLGFSSATQDIVIDAYRIESAARDLQALLASLYIAGYRVGMLVSGAGGLIVAQMLGTGAKHYLYSAWRSTYLIMAAVMLVGIATTILIREPGSSARKDGPNLYSYSSREYGRFVLCFGIAATAFVITFFYSREQLTTVLGAYFPFLLALGGLSTFLVESLRFLLAVGAAFTVARLLVAAGMVELELLRASYVAPVKEFLSRYHLKTALVLLLLIGFYRISDVVLGVISNVFYADLGFDKATIATITKTFGLFMTLMGGFLGGLLTVRYGVFNILLLGGGLSAGTNLLFLWLAHIGNDVGVLTVVIAADNLSAGIATTAFVAFLSSLTNISFTAMQYAIFSSLMTLFPKLLGGYSGTIINTIGYQSFFVFTASIGLPVLILVLLAKRLYAEAETVEKS